MVFLGEKLIGGFLFCVLIANTVIRTFEMIVKTLINCIVTYFRGFTIKPGIAPGVWIQMQGQGSRPPPLFSRIWDLQWYSFVGPTLVPSLKLDHLCL